ncbi:four helix bundle protein [Bryocella elongata]|uniref:Four helix bundle protein n=1 Tax=Bryocella elongata TaxID=863522 RepID=A0A1H5SYL6_9BACT|nr:four helix bundle protein [Bryocella elongata]SEF55554.1 four helix bundle protein [Bryocella elongata]
MQDFHHLDAWKKAHALTLRVYGETHALPHEEVFGLKMTLRRGAVGIATCLVEGCGRDSSMAFAADLQRTIVKCNEVEYLVLLARDLKLFGLELSTSLTDQVVEVRKMTFGLLKKL